MFIKYVLFYIALCAAIILCDDQVVVETTHGKLTGKVFTSLFKNEDYFGFIGIPYAAPPVKELRFLPPQPLAPWEGILAATKEKKACVQFNTDVIKGHPMGIYGSENCLYLDIFTPSPDKSKRAVIMYLHNGYFMTSYNKTKDYQHDFFMEEDVVVVTISHRLSAFGFLSLEDKTLWGNAGLKDIVTGLEWVKKNIEQFGGDPDRITLMGNKGGAAAVDFLLHSKKRSLFKSVILQSGNAWANAYLQDGVRERAFKLAEIFEKHPVTSEDLLKELRDISAKNITARDLHASPNDYFKETQRSVATFAPIIEKDPNGLIVDYPENTTEIDIPVLIGFNSREGLYQSLQYLEEPRYIFFLKKDFPLLMPIRVKFAFDPLKDAYYDAVEDVKDFYFKGGIKYESVEDYAEYMGDVVTGYSTDFAAKRYAEISTAPVYYYHFDYYSDLNQNRNNLKKLSSKDMDHVFWGAMTGDELCYLFKCPDLVDAYLKHNEAISEQRIMQMKLVKLWTNFAKYGNPTPNGDKSLEGLSWPPYTTENQQYLHIDKNMEIKQELYKDKIKFWENFFAKWEKQAVDGIIRESMNKKDEL